MFLMTSIYSIFLLDCPHEHILMLIIRQNFEKEAPGKLTEQLEPTNQEAATIIRANKNPLLLVT